VIAHIEKATVGGIEVTISKDSSGNYNTTDTLVFLKGTVRRLSPYSSLTIAYRDL
jgi:hypothetical protein